MATYSTIQIQKALIALGYAIKADGDYGPATERAVTAFQKANGLVADGDAGRKTLAVLFSAKPSAPVAPSDVPPWVVLALSKIGLSERFHNKDLRAFLKSDGRTLGNPATLPWCGDFVQTCIALKVPHDVIPANPYYALNWKTFGRALKEPALGAVLVFKRPGGGHVGFYEGERKDAYYVLGGNQSNAIKRSWVAKNRCVAIRWPKSVPLPTGGRLISTAGGKLSENEA